MRMYLKLLDGHYAVIVDKLALIEALDERIADEEDSPESDSELIDDLYEARNDAASVIADIVYATTSKEMRRLVAQQKAQRLENGVLS